LPLNSEIVFSSHLRKGERKREEEELSKALLVIKDRDFFRTENICRTCYLVASSAIASPGKALLFYQRNLKSEHQGDNSIGNNVVSSSETI